MSGAGSVLRRLGLLLLCATVGGLVGGVAGAVAGLLSGQAGFWLVGAELGAILATLLGALRFDPLGRQPT